MTLVQPVPVEPATEVGPVHFIAIGGAGMSGIAEIMLDMGIPVSGSDRADSATLTKLAARGARVHVGHAADQLGGARTVVVSSAIPADNPELVAARERGLRIWHRSTALASVMVGRRGIAVAGTHGKTTTSAMVATMLSEAGLDPSHVVGAPLSTTGTSAHLGTGEFFVIEADESDGSFLQYQPEIIVVTNVEADHLDNWGTASAYAEGYRTFAHGKWVRTAVVCADDPGSRDLAADLQTVISYGTADDATVRLSPTGPGAATVSDDSGDHPLHLQVPGLYNLRNAGAAWAVGRAVGLEADQIARGLAAFGGTHRRFQRVGTQAGVTVYDDYAHHPTEVTATLTAARDTAAGRVIVCFQPHLFSRTRAFATEFGRALRLADEVILLDIYPAREEPIPGVTSQLVLDATVAADPDRAASVQLVEWQDVPAVVADLARAEDMVLTVGAGDVTQLGPEILAALQEG